MMRLRLDTEGTKRNRFCHAAQASQSRAPENVCRLSEKVFIFSFAVQFISWFYFAVPNAGLLIRFIYRIISEGTQICSSAS